MPTIVTADVGVETRMFIRCEISACKANAKSSAHQWKARYAIGQALENISLDDAVEIGTVVGPETDDPAVTTPVCGLRFRGVIAAPVLTPVEPR